ncbi:hypothetical protein SLS62_009775 [Diatrype stigma]|uniref:DUF7704 domain-containing protein n=1 Tax=Diatrype stigma TaxID=117547 RepID=A0AAN9ULM6_9PEZI
MSATTASLLPTFPRIFFLYLEPVAIQAASIFALSSAQQSKSESGAAATTALAIPALNAPSVAMQFLLTTLLYGLVVLQSSPPNRRQLQLHIAVLALADLTHWGGLFWTIARSDPRGRGWAAALDTSGWGPEVWNLASYPITTLAIKIATLAGWFGEIRG